MKIVQPHHWFRRKTYGYGWTPSTWQGWLMVTAYVLFMLWNAEQKAQVLQFVSNTVLATIVLLIVAYLTGESPRWQWGSKQSNEH